MHAIHSMHGRQASSRLACKNRLGMCHEEDLMTEIAIALSSGFGPGKTTQWKRWLAFNPRCSVRPGIGIGSLYWFCLLREWGCQKNETCRNVSRGRRWPRLAYERGAWASTRPGLTGRPRSYPYLSVWAWDSRWFYTDMGKGGGYMAFVYIYIF